VNPWYVNENNFDPTKLSTQETVYTIGNGYFGTRGTFEEDYPGDNPATLLWGVFDSIPVGKEELANVPDWLPLKLFVNGERFRLDRGKLLAFERTLNMQNGVLTRRVSWESPNGLRLTVQSERFASLADEHVGAIRYSVTIDDQPPTPGWDSRQDVEVSLWASFNLAVGNYDLMHWESVDQGHEGDLIWLLTQTRHSGIQLAQTMSFTTQQPDFQKERFSSDVAPGIRLRGLLATGATLTAEKLVVMDTSRDVSDPLSTAIEHHQQIIADSPSTPQTARPLTNNQKTDTSASPNSQGSTYATLLVQNEEAWQNFWQQTDVIIEGDQKAQQAIRYNIYQLRISTSSHDSRYSIAAKGLTGFGYRGHVFHDTEIFMLPFFTYTLPDIARNLLLYRYRLLPAARAKAAANGYQGAQYPWESTMNGEEATPEAILHPESRELIPVLNGTLELHISASVAFAVWQYWDITGDDTFMRDYGAEILLDTAAFWVSRVQFNSSDNVYEINDVIGPDEWHEHVNNNVYTNYMAKWNIQTAIDVLSWLHETAHDKAEELQHQLDLNTEKVAHWHDVAARMCILQDKRTGLFEQFEGFFQLEHLDQNKFKGRTTSYQGLLGIEPVQHYQIIKQADVLMLLTVLDEHFDLQTKRVNWDYYYPITDHEYGSSLTPALHTILACELGLIDKAYSQFMQGALTDLENLRGNASEGIHDACCGAVWQAAILGFAGLRMTEDSYITNPCWPDGWTRLAFNFYHKGKPIHIDLHRPT
jgi:trehalose/maltose hydrolase-like predicted phosphorylase